MGAPERTQKDEFPYVPGAGGDLVVGAGAPEDVLRLWRAGESFPRIVLDVQNGNILTGNGSVAATTLSGGGGGGTSVLTSAHVFVGNGSNVATDVALSGDASITNAGVLSVVGLRGVALAVGAPTAGQSYVHNGTNFALTSAAGRTVVAKVSGYTAVDKDVVLADASSRGASDGVTNGTATVTSATAAFVAGDVGKPITGTNIPANTYIGIVNSGTSIGLSSSPTSNVPVSATGSTTAVITIGAPFSVTLPTATIGRLITVKKIDNGPNAVTVVGTIDGSTNETLTDPYASHDFIADGANWWRI